jgi:hypothetical protein
VVPIFHHNAIDILSLACLTAIVPFAFRSPSDANLRHGADLIGLARWMLQAERPEEALELFKRAVAMGLPDDLLFRTIWETASVERKLGRVDAALAAMTELAATRNPFRVRALEELAKHYEHREKNYAMALEMTRSALELEDTPEIRRREARLVTRASRPALSHFRKVSNKWTIASSATASGLHKVHGLQGPIDDAFLDSFLIVSPTGTPASRAASKTLSVPTTFTIAPATGLAWQNGMSRAARCTMCVISSSFTSALTRAVSSIFPVRMATRATCSGVEAPCPAPASRRTPITKSSVSGTARIGGPAARYSYSLPPGMPDSPFTEASNRSRFARAIARRASRTGTLPLATTTFPTPCLPASANTLAV